MAKPNRAMPGPFSGLSVKIIATIIVVILAVEVVIYLPSAANFRQSWLNDRLRVGVVAARVLDAVPDAMNLPRVLTDRLLTSAGALAIVYRRDAIGDVRFPASNLGEDVFFAQGVLDKGWKLGFEPRNVLTMSTASDCATRGFAPTGFAVVDMTGGGRTLRFALP